MITVISILISILSLTNAILAPALMFHAISKSKRFFFKEHTLTYLGNSKDAKLAFRKFLIYSSMSYAVFFICVLEKYKMTPTSGLSILLFSCCVALLAVAMTQSNFKRKPKTRLAHNTFAGAFMLLFPIALIIFQLQLVATYPILATIGIILAGLVMVVGATYFIKYKITALPEIIFVLMLSLWNLYFGWANLFIIV